MNQWQSLSIKFYDIFKWFKAFLISSFLYSKRLSDIAKICKFLTIFSIFIKFQSLCIKIFGFLTIENFFFKDDNWIGDFDFFFRNFYHSSNFLPVFRINMKLFFFYFIGIRKQLIDEKIPIIQADLKDGYIGCISQLFDLYDWIILLLRTGQFSYAPNTANQSWDILFRTAKIVRSCALTQREDILRARRMTSFRDLANCLWEEFWFISIQRRSNLRL